MHVCLSLYMFFCVSFCTCVWHIHVRMFVFLCVFLYSCLHVCLHIYVCVYEWIEARQRETHTNKYKRAHETQDIHAFQWPGRWRCVLPLLGAGVCVGRVWRNYRPKTPTICVQCCSYLLSECKIILVCHWQHRAGMDKIDQMNYEGGHMDHGCLNEWTGSRMPEWMNELHHRLTGSGDKSHSFKRTTSDGNTNTRTFPQREDETNKHSGTRAETTTYIHGPTYLPDLVPKDGREGDVCISYFMFQQE